MTLLSNQDASISSHSISGKKAVFSLDLEADYGGNEFLAVDRLFDLLNLLEEENVPLTVFVEGRILEKFPQLVLKAMKRDVDFQLHCFDHTNVSGDDHSSLKKSIDLFKSVTGKMPTGYRAHTFRLTQELYKALVSEGIKWDSSILPALFGYGANKNRIWHTAGNSYFRLDNNLYEFPVAVHPRIKIPFIHSYQMLARKWPSALVRWLGGIPDLLVFDMHMVDLVRTEALHTSKAIPESARMLYKSSWLFREENTFDELRSLIHFLKRKGYAFSSLQGLYNDLQGNTDCEQ